MLVLVTDGALTRRPQDLGFADGVLVQENAGYDLGAWAAAISRLADLARAERLALINDSVLGPTGDFEAMLQAARTADADVLGLTGSSDPVPHLQSYATFFNRRALLSRAFWKFWSQIRTGSREVVIHTCELSMARKMRRPGLVCRALLGQELYGDENTTLTRWRDLLDEGFPYIKVQLLRDNPFNADISGWEDSMRGRGRGCEAPLMDVLQVAVTPSSP